MTATVFRAINPVHSADHAAFRDSAARFVAAEVAPHLDSWRRGQTVPPAVLQRAGASGFLGTTVPERFGGGDVGDFGFLAGLIAAMVDAGAIGLAVTWALHAGVCIPFLVDHADPGDQQRWLPALVAGDLLAVPTRGATVLGLPGAGIADLFVVTDKDADSVTLVPATALGVAVDKRSPGLAGVDAGCADLDCTGVDQATCASVPQRTAALLRDVDLWLAVVALAAARRAIGLALDYASSRKVFGTVLADFENTRLRLAELAAEVASASAYVESCLTERAEGTLGAGEAAAARQVTVGLSDRAADQAMQLHGGYGYMREYPVAHAFADARFIRTAGRLYSDARLTIAREMFSVR